MTDQCNSSDKYWHRELELIAKDIYENIRHAKNVSQTVLYFYTAAFGFMCADEFARNISPASNILSGVFISGGVIVFILCSFFFPSKISERRRLLKSVYDCFGDTFEKVYGPTDKLVKNDLGDYLYAILSAIYIFALILIHVLHKYA